MKIPSITRRAFLAASAAATLSGGALSARSAEPVKREAGAKFKFSLAAYSYRGLLTGKQKSLTLIDFINDCARFGLEGTELTSYYFPTEVTTEYLRSLQRACFVNGLDVSGTAIGNDFGYAESDERNKQIANMRKWIDYADLLGAPVIRVFAGHQKEGVTAEATHNLMVAGLQECCEYAAAKGVFLALENHGGPTATADGLLKLVKDVNSPWFGVNLDTGNFRTKDPYDDIARVAPYAVNVQVKVVMKPLEGKTEPADFGRLAEIIGEAGYRGYIVLEYEEAGNPREECPKYLDQLRKAFA